jgi:hypothetical protein
MVRLASWLDVSYTVLACHENSGLLRLSTQCNSRTGCITRPLERRLMRDGQASIQSLITCGLLAPLLLHVKPGNVHQKLTDTHRMVSSLGLYFDPTTNREKLSSRCVIEEAHYGTARLPAGGQVLMDMG